MSRYPEVYHKACTHLVAFGGHGGNTATGRALVAAAIRALRAQYGRKEAYEIVEGMRFISGQFPIKAPKTHYIAMAGMHGCMPNYCASFDNESDAADSLADLHELGRKRAHALRRDGYLELNLHRDGNEYAEIEPCNCSRPEDHNDA